MHAIDKIADSKLKTLSLAMLKLTGLAEQAVREANVFDDDEFQVKQFLSKVSTAWSEIILPDLKVNY